MSLLIKNGRVINPATDTDGIMDLLIDGTRVVKAAKNIPEEADQVIDAKGLCVAPGFIDLHVHLREPGFEYKETIKTGSRAAARGGYTSICPMPNTKPAIDSADMVKFIINKAKEDAIVHVLPVGAVTKGQQGQELADIAGMVEAGAVAISEDGKSVMNASLYRDAMKLAEEHSLLVMAHCEDINLVNGGCVNAGPAAERLGVKGISNSVEDVITVRDILLAKETKASLHLCHCSTKDNVSFIRWGKEEGVKVTAEVCPHHFSMTCDEIPGNDANYKMNPPLRAKEDVEALKAGLHDGVIDCISTDHAPHSAEEKKKPLESAPFGIVGSETAFSLSYTNLVKGGVLTLPELIERMSTVPAKILGIGKGDISEGKTADLVLFDPEAEYVIDASEFASKGKNTPFGGRKVQGRICMTIVDGKVVYDASRGFIG